MTFSQLDHMMKGGTFTGLCVGGPLAGKRVTHNTPYYRCASASVEPLTRSDGMGYPSEEKLEIFTYKHVFGLRGKFEIDFWVPVEHGGDNTWAFSEIIRGYIQNAKRERTLKNS